MRRGEYSVAIVCDGCGDPASRHSEVGAALGARMIAQRLAGVLSREPGRLARQRRPNGVLEQVRREMLGSLESWRAE